MSNHSHIFYLHSSSQRYLLQRGRNQIGRGRSVCKIFLPERYYGRIHTSINIQQEQASLEISARHPITLNGRHIRIIANEAKVLIDLSNGDIITIFEHTFQFIKQEVTNVDIEDTK